MRIRRLHIERYRGLEELTWEPQPEVNCLVGPGDAGKSTVLAAIRLLCVGRTPRISEYDYFDRDVEAGFQITAVLGDLGRTITDHLRVQPLHGWVDGELVSLTEREDAEDVLVAQAVGTSDLEVDFELQAPGSDEPMSLAAKIRRRFGLARVEAGRRAMNELRFSRGSLLERHAGDVSLHGRVSDALSEAAAQLELPEEAEGLAEELADRFGNVGLPSDLYLGLIHPQHRSLLAMVGLVEGEDPQRAVPLAFAGAGTTQLVLFELAAALAEDEQTMPLVVVDEPEAGLEPYRQRRLVSRLRELVGGGGQVFMTTHAPAVLASLEPEQIFRLPPGGDPVALAGDLGEILDEDPEAFLARLPVLCEGATEQGLLSVLLAEAAQRRSALESLDSAGVRLVEGKQGQPQILTQAEEILAAGMLCGVFADAEDEHRGKRQRVADRARCVLAQWPGQSADGAVVGNTEDAVAQWVPFGKLPRIVDAAAEVAGRRRTPFLQQVGEAAGEPGRATLEELAEQCGDQQAVRDALGAAMNNDGWFKSEHGGRVLGETLLDVGAPPQIQELIDDFWDQLEDLQ